jgi:uncharacterized sulfatase
MMQMKSTRRDFLKRAGCASLLAMGVSRLSGAEAEQPKPDIVLFIADDMTWHDCQPYGSTVVKTPNLTRLASEGVCFDAMFTSTAMCAPTRQQLYTGLYPARNGAYPNHSHVHDGVRSVVHHLKDLGYRVGLIGKRHFGPEDSFPFEYFGGLEHDGGKDIDLDIKKITPFISKENKRPYCLIIASNQPHTPWNRKLEGVAYKPEDVQVPPYMVDTPVTRKLLCNYYNEISYMDSQVGACLEAIDKLGKPDRTLFMFTSEQGSQFPFGGKWTCYDTGLKTCFIVRWPGKVKPNTRTKAMTQYVDVVPTLIEAAGGDPSACDPGRPDALGAKGFDGRSFLKVLEGKAVAHRDYTYGIQTTRGIYSGSDCYPIRSARSAQYKYIWNLNWKEPFKNTVVDAAPIKSWRKLGETDPAAAERARFYQHRPGEELYDLQADPWELKNLAGDEKLAPIKAQLREKLLDWMKQQGDQGIDTEMKAKPR